MRNRQRSGLARLIMVRIALGVATLWAVSLVMFFGVAALPGDAAQAVLGQQATPQRVALLRREYGLDKPVTERYVDWLGGMVRGDLGVSLTTKTSVWSLIETKLRNTSILALCALLLLIPLSIGLGVLSALWRDTPFDHATAATSLTLLSTPEFVVGTFLIMLFSFGLGVLPATSLLDTSRPIVEQVNVLVLPVLTLVAVAVAQATRMIRATMIDVLHLDYVQSAVLRGIPRRRILLRHALPNAIDPTLQILALTAGFLVGGVVVTETLFQFPGIGSAFVDAVRVRDLPTVQATALIVTGAYIFADLVAEIGAILLNPKLRRAVR